MFFRSKRLRKWAEKNGYSFKIQKDLYFPDKWSFFTNKMVISGIRNSKTFEIIESSRISGGSSDSGTFRHEQIKIDSRIIYPAKSYFLNGGLLSIKKIENLLDDYIINGNIKYFKYLTYQQLFAFFLLILLVLYVLFIVIKFFIL